MPSRISFRWSAPRSARRGMHFASLVLLGLLAACGSDDLGPAPLDVAGSYSATVFTVVPDGMPSIDALAEGSTLSIVIAADNAVTGTLALPAAVTGDEAFQANMAGTAVVDGTTVRFTQSADSFVRDLTWTIDGTALRVVDQQAGAARFTITLQR